MKKKLLVQFDGSNFYNKVKKILPTLHLTSFDYEGLANEISKSKSKKTPLREINIAIQRLEECKTRQK